MKQKIFLLMALMAAAITFSACSSDDDDNNANSAIVGTWYTEDDGYSEEITFQKNGTVSSTTASLRYSSIRYRDGGTYSLNGNKLTIHWTKWETWDNESSSWRTNGEDDETVVITISISDNKLIFLSMEGEESYTPVVYTRQ